jgi:flagellar protein FlbD
MIELTRLNGHGIAVNCDLIKYAEAAPDTMLTLVTGEKLVVLESCTQVMERIFDYRVRLLHAAGIPEEALAPGPTPLSTLGALSARTAAVARKLGGDNQ